MSCCGKKSNRQPVAPGVVGLAKYATRTGLAPSAVIAMRRGTGGCGDCPWNMDMICEHPDCLPCKQRENGGLWHKTAQSDETCPAGRWETAKPPTL